MDERIGTHKDLPAVTWGGRAVTSPATTLHLRDGYIIVLDLFRAYNTDDAKQAALTLLDNHLTDSDPIEEDDSESESTDESLDA